MLSFGGDPRDFDPHCQSNGHYESCVPTSPEESDDPLPTTKTVIMRVTPNDATDLDENVELLARLHEVVLGPLIKAKLCHEFKFVRLSSCTQIDLTVPYDLRIKPEDKDAWQTCVEAKILVISDGEEVRKKHRWSCALPSKDAAMEINLSIPERRTPIKKRKEKQKQEEEDDYDIDDKENDSFGRGASEQETISDTDSQRDTATVDHSNSSNSPGMASQVSAAFQNFRSIGIPESEGTLLRPTMCDALWSFLPIELKWKRWRLAYKVALHGVSFQTFFNNLENQGPSILVVEDESGAVFGGFAASSWIKAAERYHGNADSFVFRWKEKSRAKTPPPLAYKILEERDEFSARFANKMNGCAPSKKSLDVYREELKADWRRTRDLNLVDPNAVQSVTEALDFLEEQELDVEEPEELEVYSWKEESASPFFQYFDGISLAFGGGNMPAFYLEDEFIRGGSGTSLTYGNPMLSGKPEFTVQDCECWRFE